MRPADLQALIDRFGALVEAWPAAQRRAAHQLLATSECARIMLAQAKAMEQALRCRPGGNDGISPQRIERVVAATIAKAATMRQARAPVPVRSWPEFRRRLAATEDVWLRCVLAIAAGVLLGLVVGHSSLDVMPASVAQNDAALASLLDAFPGTRWFGS